MKTRWVLCATLVLAGSAGAQDVDDKALREIPRKFEAAWNKSDAAGVAALYANDAVLTMPNGQTTRGRAAIQEAVAAGFRAGGTTKMTFSADEFRPLSADAAVWRCEWKSAGKDAASTGTGLAVLAKTGGTWLIVEDLAAMTPSGPPAPKKAGHPHGSEPHDHGPGGHSH